MSLEVGGPPEDMDEGLTATLNFTTIDNRECARVAGSAHTQARVSRALLPAVLASASFQEMSLPAWDRLGDDRRFHSTLRCGR